VATLAVLSVGTESVCPGAVGLRIPIAF
jgi:hypothetical protein